VIISSGLFNHWRQCSTKGWSLVSINSGGLRPRHAVAKKNKATQ